MKLHLYVWTEHFADGLVVSGYRSWEEVAWFISHWQDPSHVFTVIYEEERLEIEVLDKTIIRYSFVCSDGEVDDLCFTLEDVENGKAVEWFENTGNEITERTLIIGEKKEK